MGVKLTGIIHKKEINFSDLKGKKIAVDFSNMAYQFLSNIRQPDGTPLMDSKERNTSVYQGIISRISNLMSQRILLCFVMDGKPPSLKVHEKEQREHRKQLAEKRLEKAKEEDDEESMLKYSKQTSRLTKDIVEDSKLLLKAMGLPVIQAPSEADSQMSHLCEVGDVDYVATSDIDSLLHGCPKLLLNLTLSQRRKIRNTYIKINPEMIELKQVLKELEINQDQLIILAILVGTDYNQGIKGIGPKTALKLVKQNKNFDKLFKELKPDFDWKRIYATFKSMPIMKNYQLKWSEPDENKIKKILVDKHDFSEKRVDKIIEKITKKEKKQKGLSSFFKS